MVIIIFRVEEYDMDDKVRALLERIKGTAGIAADAAAGALVQISPPLAQLFLGFFEVDGLGRSLPPGSGKEVLEVGPEKNKVV